MCQKYNFKGYCTLFCILASLNNENFTTKNLKFSDKKFWYFSYFCSKHRLLVLVRISTPGGSNEYPQYIVLNRNKKSNVYPCKPQFYNIKVGFKGVKLYRYVFVMRMTQNVFTEQHTNENCINRAKINDNKNISLERSSCSIRLADATKCYLLWSRVCATQLYRDNSNSVGYIL